MVSSSFLRRSLDLSICVAAANADAELSPVIRERLNDMETFVTNIDGWYEDMLTIPHNTLKALMKLGARITGVLTR